ncbi:molecular chaperone GrpE [Kribbella voronezhensis]|uniref:Protein GrpE n=1 Tax=Kribbella voronezhensis TaxID=2512212 RepID=A0A4R7TFZ7_9ACTN|nr:nucleotide exchange factor GrpE [Kribbella voronezhensis]TDU91192.1 molecular chaperone GrpE [Kribbella voronezhensis]
MAEQETDTTDTAPPVEEALEQARQKAAELEDNWRRTAAELDNFRKRVARESSRQRDTERALVTAGWLPVVDNLELALEHADGEDGAIVEGVRAVRDQALAVLAGLGYPRFDDEGKPFDPALHEAVGTTPRPEVPPGTIVHVVRPRYGDGERVLRPAAVVVAAKES